MHFISIVFAASAVAATPLQPKRAAAILPYISPRYDTGPAQVFDVAAYHQERQLIRKRYGNIQSSSRIDDKLQERSEPSAGVFDVFTRSYDSGAGLRVRQGTSAAVPLVDVFNQTDTVYTGSIQIGTPPQTTTVVFDTGSSDIVIPLSECIGCTGPLFSEKNSTTYLPSPVPFSSKFQDQSGVQGIVASESIAVGTLSVLQQGFGAVTNVIGSFRNKPAAGIFGLGYPANAVSRSTPFFVNLVSGAKLVSNVFSIYQTRRGAVGSELCLGCINSSKYTGPINYYPLDPTITNGTQVWWNTPGQFIFNGLTVGPPMNAMIDSGTTLVIVPRVVADGFYAQIINAIRADTLAPGLYTLPCAQIATLPAVGFAFGGVLYAINPIDLNAGVVSPGSATCVVGVAADDTLSGLAIVGDTWMKNWYSVFDYGASRLGFAKSV
ncbi:hypothetical protein FRB99_002190 [Tulasnella sp. 403]|nr:hypothetical protein FRB99_002190 [Tulasnella sp. 403]